MKKIETKNLKICFKLLGLLALGIHSASAMEKWTQITDNESDTVFTDISSVSKSGNKVKMWNLLNLKKNVGDNYSSLKSLQEYDCKENKSRVISYTTYSAKMGNGNVVKSNTTTHDWLPVKPGGRTALLWKTACTNKK